MPENEAREAMEKMSEYQYFAMIELLFERWVAHGEDEISAWLLALDELSGMEVRYWKRLMRKVAMVRIARYGISDPLWRTLEERKTRDHERIMESTKGNEAKGKKKGRI